MGVRAPHFNSEGAIDPHHEETYYNHGICYAIACGSRLSG